MTGLCKHPQTGQWWFRKATPVDLYARRSELAAMGISITREVKHTLAVKPKEAVNKIEAEIRASKANAECLQRFDAMRDALKNGPSKLSGMQVAAMTGEIARRLLKSDPNLNDDYVETKVLGELKITWQRSVDLFGLIAVHGLDHYKGIRELINKFIAKALLKQGIVAIDNQSRQQLEARIVKDLPAHAQMLANMQEEGDYELPEVFKRRPALDVAFAAKAAPQKVTFTTLIDGWQRNKKPAPATVKAYINWCKAFVRWSGSDDVSTITRKQMIAWREALEADLKFNDKGRRDKLTGVRTVIEWGINNEKLPYNINPAKGVTLKASKSPREGWPDEQAALMLTKAREQTGYLRWAPLLMAVTGARATEIAQVRLIDLQEDDKGQWTIRITAEAGRLKNESSERTIPLHSAVVTEGLPAYVKSFGGADDRLFPEFFPAVTKRKEGNDGLSQASGNKYRDWIYGAEVGLIADKRYASRHSWRHRLSSLIREYCQNDAEARLAGLLGHAQTTITSRYGKAAPMKLLRDAVESIPSDAIFGVANSAK
jgi:integrase